MKVEPFTVEQVCPNRRYFGRDGADTDTQWMDAYETTATYNIAETCCDSISLTDLVTLSGSSSVQTDTLSLLDTKRRQDYGHIRGLPKLKENIAKLYQSHAPRSTSPNDNPPLPTDNVLITQGAIAANFLLLYTLIGAGDHVICHHPTYQQLYSLPATLGAKVDLWKAKPEKDWVPDIAELAGLLRDNTRLIIIK